MSTKPRNIARQQKRKPFFDFLWLLGGTQALVGLAYATVVGVWIGLSPPDFVAVGFKIISKQAKP
jgi:hypothetical protein